MLPAVMLGCALFLSYRIVRVEVEAHLQSLPQAQETEEPEGVPAGREPEKERESPAQRQDKTGRPKLDAPSHEGSRRDWYEKRKRRWFTPPEQRIDTGLPEQRSKFKLS